MTNLARIFLATTLVLILTVIALVFGIIQEAKRSSVYSAQSYVNGFHDGEWRVVARIERALLQQQIIDEAAEEQAHVAEEKL